MATLTALFKGVDQVSVVLDRVAQSGSRMLDTWHSAETAATEAFNASQTGADRTARSIDELNNASAEYGATSRSVSSAIDGSSDALDDLSRSADRAEREVEDYGESSENAGRQSEEMGRRSVGAIQDLSSALAAAGIAQAIRFIYEAFADAVMKAVEFESAITGVYKTVNGTDEQLRNISSEIKDMSTVMPASAASIAGVAEAAGQLGIATDDITTFTGVMINLGEATNLSSEEAASALAKFTNITGMSAEYYENLGSTVVALGNNFATTEADIVGMSTRLASAGTLAGLTESDILALAASMSSVGIEADAGGSAMSKLITDMQVAVETGSDRLEEFATVAGMTGNEFASLFGEKAVDALYAFISGLNDTERNGATATVILENMGLTEIRLSNAVKSLANNHEGLSSAIDLASGAWVQNTALATEANLRYGTLESRMAMTENAATNLAAAFGDDLTPVVGAVVDAGRGMFEWMTRIIEENPAVTAALTALAIGIGIVAAAITVFALVTSPIVVTAIHSITAAMMANPIFLIITGVVALTAAVVAFVAILASQESEYDSWTASTKQQYDELQSLNSEYDAAVEKYGETSEEALNLRYEIDELNASFEANKKTVEEFVAECDALVEAHNKIVQSYAEATAELDSEALGTQSLINKLSQLTSKTSLSEAEHMQMNAIIEQLNESMPELALNYDETTNSLNLTTDALKKMAAEQAKQEKQEENYRAYVDLVKEQTALEEKLAEAEANLTAERERRNMVFDETTQQWSNAGYTEDSLWASWTTDLDEYGDALTAAQTAYDENIAMQEMLTTEMGNYATEMEAAKNATIGYDEAVSAALDTVKGELSELAAKYDEAYIAAYDSINSQIGLFDTMKTETELSISDMTTAMQSQIDYLNTYGENLKLAADFGLDEGLIDSLSDGSAESAGQLDAIIEKVQELGGTTAEAQEFINGFNSSFEEVQTAKETFATQVATMQTDFEAAMDGINEKLVTSIENMNMSTDSAAAATATINAYVANIRAGKDSAVSAAESVAAATAAALSSTPGAPKKGYAVGTASAAPGLALVGEEGPELINFGGGEIVYTAPETQRILANAGDLPATNVPEQMGPETSREGGYSEKKIALEINGSGEIDVSGADEETVWGIVAPKLKSAFMGIIKQEIFEEGDLAYEF